MELIQQSKWRCDVNEMRIKHALDGKSSENVQSLITIYGKIFSHRDVTGCMRSYNIFLPPP